MKRDIKEHFKKNARDFCGLHVEDFNIADIFYNIKNNE